MATTYQPGRIDLPPTQGPTPCVTCTTTCPACGGLECLCRPRFFAGQLLTEDDLNLLDRYIVEKNKLHNRYLIGWGVVCGLEVSCNQCAGVVTVRSGYALSPCGEDIVLCRDEQVDICALIQQCTNQQTSWNCQPYPSTTGVAGCEDLEEQWILSVRYDEKPSHGVTALRGSSASTCCSRCSGGGSTACGCGGGSSCSGGCGGRSKPGCTCGPQTNGGAGRPSGRNAPPQCEPTVTCEGYVFELCKAPPAHLRGDQTADPGPLIDHFQRCFKAFVTATPPFPGLAAAPQDLYAWCCATKAAMLNYFSAYGTYDCQWMTRLAAFPCPVPGAHQSPDDYRKNFASVPGQLAGIAGEGIRYCLCSSLLPPCPEAVCDPRVPLATITVRASDCSIVRVCDWSNRKLAVTLPTLEYWLSAVPIFRHLKDAIIRMCCGAFTPRNLDVGANNAHTFGGVAAATVNQSSTDDFTTILMEALANPSRMVDAETVFMGMTGAVDTQGQPFMTPTEMANPFQFLVLNQAVAPAIAASLPARQTVSGATVAPDVAALNARMEEMQQRINELEARLPGNG